MLIERVDAETSQLGQLKGEVGLVELLVVLALLILPATCVHAGVLVEYLFWDTMGNQVGNAAKHYLDVKRERQKWKDNIAEAERELKACGGCASAKAKLEKWQGIENQFQEFAGGVAASVGMPPTLAKFLDIDMPLVPPSTPEEVQLELPAWASDRPPACQAAIEEHFACLKQFQAERQVSGLSTTAYSISLAYALGGPCYESKRLYSYCAKENYQGFQEERKIIQLREEGAIIPQVHSDKQDITIYFGMLPDDAPLNLPPEEIILEEWAGNTFSLKFFSRKDGSGLLDQIRIFGAHHTYLHPTNNCFDGSGDRPEMERRVCEDLSLISFYLRLNDRHYPILQCDYTKDGGSFQVGATLHATRPEWSHRYWYAKTPELMAPERLLKRDHGHPLLDIGAPRTQCPQTLAEANGIEEKRVAEIAKLRTQIDQESASVALPVPEAIRERRQRYAEDARKATAKALAAFPIEGSYQRIMHYVNGSKGRSECSFKKQTQDVYDVKCRDRRKNYGATARITEDGLLIEWSERLHVLYRPTRDNTALNGHGFGKFKDSGYFERLGRVGDKTFEDEFAERVAAYQLEGLYRLEIAPQRNLRDKSIFSCSMTRDATKSPHTFDTQCRNVDTAAEFTATGKIIRVGHRTNLVYSDLTPPPVVGEKSVSAVTFTNNINLEAAGYVRNFYSQGDGIKATLRFDKNKTEISLAGNSVAHRRETNHGVTGRGEGPISEASKTQEAPISISECPRTFMQFRQPNGRFECACPANVPLHSRVFGTDVYASISSVCAAAIHAGRLDKAGGFVTVVGVPSDGIAFEGSERNGVKSQELRRDRVKGAFRFVSELSANGRGRE